ncbi:hypothetical protein EJ05DRAFT_474445 [Pseudovirgaria hyperparasitica]|uniref:Uncharacterized protein n=1 Tax=Pseudovirgaria hyperparasitica TaxID=470096 RepID=A0A6A6WCM2_9PEZI|nr:uncharacterized protein EJ05DRAFT_474445 [Pseudovirgaria hyperparasitica]KAF2760582.1 hypothetical protein EJ05DRAFT_474445 [Pseudovirgaria hyperparasitica]
MAPRKVLADTQLRDETVDHFSIKYKAIVLTLRSLAVALSFGTLSLYIVALCLYLVRTHGDIDVEATFKYLSITGSSFSAAWHLFAMCLLGSGALNRIPRWFYLGLEIGSGVLMGILGYLSYAQDRIGRPPQFTPEYQEEAIKSGAVGVLTAACAAHLGFFIFGLCSKARPVDSDTERNRSCDACTSLHKIPSTTTTTEPRPVSPAHVSAEPRTENEPTTTTVPTSTRPITIPDEDAPAYTPGDYQHGFELRTLNRQHTPRTTAASSSTATDAPILLPAHHTSPFDHSLATQSGMLRPTPSMAPVAPQLASASTTEKAQRPQSRLFGSERSDLDFANVSPSLPSSPTVEHYSDMQRSSDVPSSSGSVSAEPGQETRQRSIEKNPDGPS